MQISDAMVLEAVGNELTGTPTPVICKALRCTAQDLGEIFENLESAGSLRSFAGLWYQPAVFEEAIPVFMEALMFSHLKAKGQPLVPRERVSELSGLKWAGKPLDRILAELSRRRLLFVEGTKIRHCEFQPELPTRQRQLLDRVVIEIRKEEVNVPSLREIARAITVPVQAVEEIVNIGVQAGELLDLGTGLFYTVDQIDKIKLKISEHFVERELEPSELRDFLGSSRKYVIPLLEFFDAVGFTTRIEERRFLR